jgi:exopolysaccharide biosynthesis polyprenyl glycosylphosphotransferase
VILDLVGAVVAGEVVVLLRYQGGADLAGVDYRLLVLAFAVLWVTTLALTGGYDRRVLGVGTEEFRRVASAAVRALAALAVIVVAGKLDVARSVVGLGLPFAAALTLVGRWGARKYLHQARRAESLAHHVLLVGGGDDGQRLAVSLARHREAGLRVVGACGDGPPPAGVPLMGSVEDVARVCDELGVDTVAVAGLSALGPEGLRRLSWTLERRGIDLLLAPGLLHVAVPRIVFRPVDGIPLLHVDEPRLSGPKQWLKSSVDRGLGVLVLLSLSPLILLLACGVVLTSRGPAFFRQERVGREGKEFHIWKLRTMVDGAEQLPVASNDADGLLFKLRGDPRVTPLGRFLRRWSLDELPQLLNVVTGSMSLVGPRPPLPGEVARYGDDVRRRLLVRPGMTGLWQVSGRSDLSWEESVRLDLQYVENWSLSLDAVILLRTVSAVLARRGAY